MTPDEFNELTQKIVAANGDQGAMTAMLTQATKAFSDLFAVHASVNDKNDKLTKENEKLKEYNMQLFLERGEMITAETTKQDTGKSKEIERAETITIEDLFSKEE